MTPNNMGDFSNLYDNQNVNNYTNQPYQYNYNQQPYYYDQYNNSQMNGIDISNTSYSPDTFGGYNFYQQNSNYCVDPQMMNNNGYYQQPQSNNGYYVDPQMMNNYYSQQSQQNAYYGYDMNNPYYAQQQQMNMNTGYQYNDNNINPYFNQLQQDYYGYDMNNNNSYYQQQQYPQMNNNMYYQQTVNTCTYTIEDTMEEAYNKSFEDEYEHYFRFDMSPEAIINRDDSKRVIGYAFGGATIIGYPEDVCNLDNMRTNPFVNFNNSNNPKGAPFSNPHSVDMKSGTTNIEIIHHPGLMDFESIDNYMFPSNTEERLLKAYEEDLEENQINRIKFNETRASANQLFNPYGFDNYFGMNVVGCKDQWNRLEKEYHALLDEGKRNRGNFYVNMRKMQRDFSISYGHIRAEDAPTDEDIEKYVFGYDYELYNPYFDYFGSDQFRDNQYLNSLVCIDGLEAAKMRQHDMEVSARFNKFVPADADLKTLFETLYLTRLDDEKRENINKQIVQDYDLYNQDSSYIKALRHKVINIMETKAARTNDEEDIRKAKIEAEREKLREDIENGIVKPVYNPVAFPDGGPNPQYTGEDELQDKLEYACFLGSMNQINRFLAVPGVKERVEENINTFSQKEMGSLRNSIRKEIKGIDMDIINNMGLDLSFDCNDTDDQNISVVDNSDNINNDRDPNISFNNKTESDIEYDDSDFDTYKYCTVNDDGTITPDTDAALADYLAKYPPMNDYDEPQIDLQEDLEQRLARRRAMDEAAEKSMRELCPPDAPRAGLLKDAYPLKIDREALAKLLAEENNKSFG